LFSHTLLSLGTANTTGVPALLCAAASAVNPPGAEMRFQPFTAKAGLYSHSEPSNGTAKTTGAPDTLRVALMALNPPMPEITSQPPVG
jgi:hypothetical protein